jgi:energy-coupling factor transporter transmembrane protein EcfT
MNNSEARVFGVLDIITKPLQWLIGGIKALFLLLIVAGVCIIAPIYSCLHGGGFSSFEFALGCYILGFLIMLFGAPIYTTIWCAAIFFSLMWWDINASQSSQLQFIAVAWVYEGVGLCWVGTKIGFKVNERRERRATRKEYRRSETTGGQYRKHNTAFNEATATSEVPEDGSSLSSESCCQECTAAYETLGLENGSTLAEVKDAHRDLVKVWHPDRFSGKQNERLRHKAEDALKRLNYAYGHLRSHLRIQQEEFSIDVRNLDVNAALCYMNELLKEVQPECANALARMKTGGIAGRTEAMRVLDRTLARAEVVYGNFQQVLKRMREELPEVAGNPDFVEAQQSAAMIIQLILEIKTLRGRFR